MTQNLTLSPGTFAIFAVTAMAFSAPADAVTTTRTSASISNMSFTFSDPSSYFDVNTFVSGSTSVTSLTTYLSTNNVLFEQNFPGFGTSNNSGSDAMATASASTTSNSVTADLSRYAGGAVPGYSSADSSVFADGNFHLAPHSTATFSADYSMTASSADGNPYLTTETLVTFFQHSLRFPVGGPGPQEYLLATAGQSFQQTGTLTWTVFNDSSSQMLQPFSLRAESDAYVSTTLAVPEPGTWALSILGLGLTGAGLARRRRLTQAGRENHPG